MIKGTLKIKNNITPVLKKQQVAVDRIPKDALKVFVQKTPIKKGNARRKTKLRGNSIDANYPYAQRLNEGYSKQSPEGMVNPTVEFIKQRFRQIMSGK